MAMEYGPLTSKIFFIELSHGKFGSLSEVIPAESQIMIKKITYLTWFDVVVKHLDVFISVGSGLLVNKPNGVHHFVKNCTQSLAAVTNGDILFSTLSTHKRVTPKQTKKTNFQWCAAKLSKLPSQQVDSVLVTGPLVSFNHVLSVTRDRKSPSVMP